MTPVAFVLVFVSVFLHVTWNMLSKSNRPSMAFYALMSATASLIWLPFFIFGGLGFGELPPGFFPLLAGSVIFEVMYMLGLARAYKKGDISFVYPVVRALPVIMLAGIVTGFGLESRPLDASEIFGMLMITAGCLVMPLKSFSDFRLKNYLNGTIGFVLLGAAGTTGYTLCDRFATGIIAETVGGGPVNTLSYLFLIEFGLTLGELLFVIAEKEERAIFRKLFLRSPAPIAAGVCSSSAYGMILLAMYHISNVSYIQAFRQISLPIGFLAGVIILKERATPAKLAGVALIVAGLAVVALT